MNVSKSGQIRIGVIFIITISISIASGMWITKYFNNPQAKEVSVSEYSGRVFEPPIPLQSFKLTDHEGNSFSPVNLLGYWTFVFFGYTNCPDVCPMALVDLNAVYDDLESKFVLGNTKVLFVSVDPERDNLNHLADYISYFNEDFTGVTGNAFQIETFAKQFGAVYKRVENEEDAEDYLVDHTASIMLIDHLGRLISIFPPPLDHNKIVADFLKLRDRYGDGYGCLIN